MYVHNRNFVVVMADSNFDLVNAAVILHTSTTMYVAKISGSVIVQYLMASCDPTPRLLYKKKNCKKILSFNSLKKEAVVNFPFQYLLLYCAAAPDVRTAPQQF